MVENTAVDRKIWVLKIFVVGHWIFIVVGFNFIYLDSLDRSYFCKLKRLYLVVFALDQRKFVADHRISVDGKTLWLAYSPALRKFYPGCCTWLLFCCSSSSSVSSWMQSREDMMHSFFSVTLSLADKQKQNSWK